MKRLFLLFWFVFVFSNTATADHIWVHGNCLPGNPQYDVSDVPLLAPDWLVDDWTHVIAGCTGSTFLRSDKKLYQLCPNNQNELCFLMDGIVLVAAMNGDYWQVLKDDGTVWGWGDNATGNLGDGTFNNYREEPVQALGLTKCLVGCDWCWRLLCFKRGWYSLGMGEPEKAATVGDGIGDAQYSLHKFLPIVTFQLCPNKCRI